MLLLLFLVLVPVFFGTLVALLVRSGRAAFDRRWERLLGLLLSGAALLVLGLALLHLGAVLPILMGAFGVWCRYPPCGRRGGYGGRLR
ncbi:hypothetical protein, partial [Kitasatospora cineracea]|uniref:hypothetical protein n=1 Tax=Kitasatospora cineracea TaxID=88074 RepID=UPI0033D1D8F2